MPQQLKHYAICWIVRINESNDVYSNPTLLCPGLLNYMQLDQAIAQLQSYGFYVTVRSWAMGDPTLVVATPADEAGNRGEDYIQALKDVSWIYFRAGQWGFHKVDHTGGIGPNDIDYPTATLDEAVSVLLNYYFGEPVAVGDWLIPIHKHPEWDLDAVQSAIDQAQQISPDKWIAIQREHKELYFQLARPTTFSDLFSYVFVTVSHVHKTDLRLHLRRDLRHAFVVSGFASASLNP